MPNIINMAQGRPYPCHPIHQQRVLGCNYEIDYRTKVGTDAWNGAHPPRIKKLSALRRSHMIREHHIVKAELGKRGYERAVEVPPAEWVDIVQTFEARDQARGITR